MKKLSEPQERFMLTLGVCFPLPVESPAGYGRESKTLASAWHRTAHSLKNVGLVRVERCGDHFQARLTEAGRARQAQLAIESGDR